MPESGRLRLDPLQVFAIALAACLAAMLFFIAVVSNVTVGTAATRAIVSWVVLSLLGIAVTTLVRWVLRAPPPGD
ncbi:MAG TPA: hypothetical protein VFC93_12705 [Chloroflexota bacterium]|jgi:uncharacterized membrane protein|nr:hypothetical protein [Chloroflexota bacterium]